MFNNLKRRNNEFCCLIFALINFFCSLCDVSGTINEKYRDEVKIYIFMILNFFELNLIIFYH